MTSIVHLLDGACVAIIDGFRNGRTKPSQLRVSPSGYESVALVKSAELSRGNPLVLLDLDVVLDPSLEGDRTAITWAGTPEQEPLC
ncbi:hypothetical protein VSH64_09955 [Amycolatopsis rhabdoformis]|uniref:Uncharacterized protein n=1 Tax=Amycolatopsis rhabdoformis TaxID=1448059 RepID=A0ABZ1IF98_9PSEU|nr:hypothetical protein [Amycolatopsis rhabdoformis]WSE32426.1 hypothetical protein VSH64_09955 [Amycolatopsis rhabdoformis]